MVSSIPHCEDNRIDIEQYETSAKIRECVHEYSGESEVCQTSSEEG